MDTFQKLIRILSPSSYIDPVEDTFTSSNEGESSRGGEELHTTTSSSNRNNKDEANHSNDDYVEGEAEDDEETENYTSLISNQSDNPCNESYDMYPYLEEMAEAYKIIPDQLIYLYEDFQKVMNMNYFMIFDLHQLRMKHEELRNINCKSSPYEEKIQSTDVTIDIKPLYTHQEVVDESKQVRPPHQEQDIYHNVRYTMKDIIIWIEKYMIAYLGHYYKNEMMTEDDQFYENTMLTFPVLFPIQFYGQYFTHGYSDFDESDIFQCISDDTFIVDSNLDFIYSDVIDTLLFSYLYNRIDLLRNGIDSVLSEISHSLSLKLNIIERNHDLNRENKKKRFLSCNSIEDHHRNRKQEQQQQSYKSHHKTCPFSWRIYTKTSSSFFKEVMQLIHSSPSTATDLPSSSSSSPPIHHFKFDYSYMDIEYIPFQLVILLTNINKYRDCSNQCVKETEPGEWVSLPILYYKLWQISSTSSPI